MTIKRVMNTGRVPVKSWTEDIEDTAKQQLHNLSQLPFIHKHVACMPDVHAGFGSTVGSVIATKGAIIPSAVGVDIGCGMMAVSTTLTANDLPDSLANLRHSIERAVPVGFNQHKAPVVELNPAAADFINRPQTYYFAGEKNVDKAWEQLGTLGGGNHFIELCLDLDDRVWVMLHSGSRGVGNIIGRRYIELAKEEMRKWHIYDTLPDGDLSYLVENTDLFDEYIECMLWAQDYAKYNREIMMTLVLDEMMEYLPEFQIVDQAINCHHNYAERENHFGSNVWVTRKGAVRAREGDLGIIPGSMGAKSFIVRGKGAAESFHSCSHGAGRKMSRTKAKATFTVEDLKKQTEGVECRKDENVVDEIPGAYKDIDEVMANQSNLVEVVAQLRQVMCIKG